MISTILGIAFNFSTLEDFTFKRTFVAKSEAFYTVTMTLPGGFGTLKSTIQSTVQTVTDDGATVHLKALNIDMPGFPTTQALPDLTTKVGPLGMPNKASIKNGEEFFVFLGIASLTPGTKTSVGQTVTIHWVCDSKQFAIDGTGKIGKLDPNTKTLTVDWDIDMKPNYTDGGKFTVKSVYSTTDFSLTSSEGAMGVGGTNSKISIARKVKA